MLVDGFVQQAMWSDVATKEPLVFSRKLVSDEQNSTELIAAVLGIAGLIVRGAHDCAVTLVGDNKSALSWATGPLHSTKALGAYVLLGELCRLKMVFVVKKTTELILSEMNTTPNKLSRFDACETDPSIVQLERNPVKGEWVARALKFMDPTVDSHQSILQFKER